jgi:hypothetical protein
MNFILPIAGRKGFGVRLCRPEPATEVLGAAAICAESSDKSANSLRVSYGFHRPSPEGALMPYQIRLFFEAITRAAERLDRDQWIIVSVLVLALGLVCMRGFGSRKDY